MTQESGLREFEVRIVAFFVVRRDRIQQWDMTIPAADFEHASEKCRRMLVKYLPHDAESIFGAGRDGAAAAAWEWRLKPGKSSMHRHLGLWPQPPWDGLPGADRSMT